MKNRFFFALFSSLLLFGATSFSPLKAAEFEFKLHQFLPLKSAVPQHFLQPWIEKVEKESGGRIKIAHFPSMQLGGRPPALISQVTDGVVDFAWTLTGYTPGRFPRSEVFELPFMVTNGENTSKAFYEYYEPYFEEEFPGLKVITVYVHGPGLIHIRSRSVKTLSDMNGLKLRGPTRIITSLIKELGASPVGMPVPKVPESLSKGVIDGALLPWEVTIPLKTSDMVKYHTEFGGDRGIYTAAFVFAMNKKSYDSLPKDLQKVIDNNSGIEAAARAGHVEDLEDIRGRKIAVEKGNQINLIDGPELEKWKTRSEKVVEQWYKDMVKKNIDGPALYKKARQLIDKYNQDSK